MFHTYIFFFLKSCKTKPYSRSNLIKNTVFFRDNHNFKLLIPPKKKKANKTKHFYISSLVTEEKNKKSVFQLSNDNLCKLQKKNKEQKISDGHVFKRTVAIQYMRQIY